MAGLGDGDVAALRADPSPLARLDIATILAELDRFVRSIAPPPIVKGHSFGGLFAQLLAYRGLGCAPGHRSILQLDTAPKEAS